MSNPQLLILGSSIFIPPHRPFTTPTATTTTTATSRPSLHARTTKPPPPPPSTSSSPPRPPLLSTVRWDLAFHRPHRLRYYAVLASNLASEGKFQDFLMLAESVIVSGVRPSQFVELLRIELVSAGIVRVLREGKPRSVIEMLIGAEKLGIDSVKLFEDSAMAALARECRRIAKCGGVEELLGIMETLAGFHFTVKDLMDPYEIIKVFVNKGSPDAAIRFACSFPDTQKLFCFIIQEFGKKRDLVSALTVFQASQQNQGYPNMYAYRTIIDVCGLCGDYSESRSVYEELCIQMVTPNLYVFNSLMNVNAHDLSYTLHVYKNMQLIRLLRYVCGSDRKGFEVVKTRSGVKADMSTYNILLKSCCLAGRIDLAQDIYGEVQHLESTGILKLDLFTYSTIIKVFADGKMWEMAIKIKEDMLEAGVTPNMVTWSSLMSACANAGLIEQAIKLFEEMLLAGCQPNSLCCNILLHACVEARQYDRAFRLFQSWKGGAFPQAFSDVYCGKPDTNIPSTKIRFSPTASTYNTLLKACGTDYRRAIVLMDEMRAVGLSPNHISWSILIDVCGGSGNVKGAMQVLKSMRDAGIQPDVVAYTTAIKVCVKRKHLRFAFSLFAEMKRFQVKPNIVTYNTLLRARSKYGSLQEVQQCLAIYQDMRKAGYKSNDYYLKQLIEEWCEGIIQDDNQRRGPRSSCNRTDLGGPQSLLLEKVAAQLQKSDAESLAVDLQGHTKVEARLVVLAVLRMIKENYTPGRPVKDDMLIILGVQEVGASAVKHELNVKDAIIKLLRNDLGLKVLLARPSMAIKRENPSYSNLEDLRGSALPTQLESPTWRPALLERLKVTGESLSHWLRKRSGDSRR
ncbi:hypothetical protein RJ639_006749 [Escallonia herrerae]|uniref:Pentatricopeptide repeat-containing protein n=1 Tax=Escallonia herrerae TaxID=1293975 RepID=A0AA88W005_9ASTE|nr:hypothetical protein RJ639_006749 [Escallonia herrerae]